MRRYLGLLQHKILLYYPFLSSIPMASWKISYEFIAEEEQTLSLVYRWFGGLDFQEGLNNSSVELKVETATWLLGSSCH